MPEYLAPGVYVEEVSYRAKSIEGVGTTTTGFVGPTRYGPIDGELEVLTSLVDFERTYGDRQPLDFDDAGPIDNYVWHAARAFFEEGGSRLYVRRIFNGDEDAARPVGFAGDGASASGWDDGLRIRARYPGEAGRARVRLTLELGQNVLAATPDGPRLNGVFDNDIVVVSAGGSTPALQTARAERYLDEGTGDTTWRFHTTITSTPDTPIELADLDRGAGALVRRVTLGVAVTPPGPDAITATWSGLALDPAHELAGTPDSAFAHFSADPNVHEARSTPITIELGANVDNGLDVLDVLAPDPSTVLTALLGDDTDPAARSVDVLLKGGGDGNRPTGDDYVGEERTDGAKLGLVAFEDLDDIAIVAAPGSTFGYENGYRDQAQTALNGLISHAQRMRYRIAVLDSGDGQTVADVRAMRAQFDSTYAALYYPWVRIVDPVTQRVIVVPPSGAIAGIYARNDINRAVYKAPANEVVTSGIGFETLLNRGQQEVLNPEGVNCLRYLEGRGYRVWGARTISSDPEWKYVNLRRYFAYLEHSIDRGTQWAVFEPNGDQLWATVRRTIEDFLFSEFQSGALLGDKPEKAYFVRCDRSTMTQNDLDNGRLVCLIGVAALRPAEFVIFRIGQWTADRRG